MKPRDKRRTPGLSIRLRLILLVAVGLAGLGVFFTWVAFTTERDVGTSAFGPVIENKDLIADILPPPMFVVEAYAVALEIRGAPPADVPGLADRVDQLSSDFEARKAFWKGRIADPRMESELARVQETGAAVLDLIRRDVIPAARAGVVVTVADRVDDPLKRLYQAHRVAVDALVKSADGRSTALTRGVAASIARQLRNEALLVGFLALLMMALGLLTIRSVSGPLARAVETLGKIRDGDLTQRLPTRDDEIGAMAAALNESLETIASTLQRVQEVAATVTGAADELASASGHILDGAQQQASGLEQSAASLEQITATVKQSADNVREASRLAMTSRDAAERGGEVVARAVDAMVEINQASRRIGEIIGTIDELAFQTNLLALNAAVEAARAGEQGRGFAVVAGEVRLLAQRSALASREIRGLIQESVQRVEVGSDLVSRSGVTLEEIVRTVKGVTESVTEIASAAREQSSGIDQVNRAIATIDQVTQHNAARTEELSATAIQLRGQAAEVRSLVGRFHVMPEGTGRSRPPPAGPPPPAWRRASTPGSARSLGLGCDPRLDDALPSRSTPGPDLS